jgi:hypothetical protein
MAYPWGIGTAKAGFRERCGGEACGMNHVTAVETQAEAGGGEVVAIPNRAMTSLTPARSSAD